MVSFKLRPLKKTSRLVRNPSKVLLRPPSSSTFSKMNSDHDPGSDAGVTNSFVPRPPSRRRSRTEEHAISKNARSRPTKHSGHSGSTSPNLNSPPCSVCGKQFQSLKALYGHLRCHPERKWRGSNPPPHMAEKNQKVVDSVNESGGENKMDKTAEEVIMAEDRGEVNTSESVISSCRREEAPPSQNRGPGSSDAVEETEERKERRLSIDLNKLPDEAGHPDSSDPGYTLVFEISFPTFKKD